MFPVIINSSYIEVIYKKLFKNNPSTIKIYAGKAPSLPLDDEIDANLLYKKEGDHADES